MTDGRQEANAEPQLEVHVLDMRPDYPEHRIILPVGRLLSAVARVDRSVLAGQWEIWTAWGCHGEHACAIEDQMDEADVEPLRVTGPEFFGPFMADPEVYFEFLVMRRISPDPEVVLGVFDSSWLFLRAGASLVRAVAAQFEEVRFTTDLGDFRRWF